MYTTEDALLGTPPEDNKKFSEMDKKEKISAAVKNVNHWFDYFNENINNGIADLAFVMDDLGQWDEGIASQRAQLDKPCFQINNIYPIVTGLIAQIRKNTPEFKVFSAADQMNAQTHIDQKAIDLRENLLRQISYENNAEIQFQIAVENSLCRSYGAILVGTEYENEFSFNQRPTIKGILDPAWCFWDPADLSCCKTEGRFSGHLQTFTFEEYKTAYPNSKYAEKNQWPTSFPASSQATKTSVWFDQDFIRIAHYFVREQNAIKIYQMNNGGVMKMDEAIKAIEEDKQKRKEAKKDEGLLKKMMMQVTGQASNQPSPLDNIEPLDFALDEDGNKISRDSTETKIMHCIFSNDEELEETEWPSDMLPLVYVDGHSHWINGQQITKSFHRTAKDPQRILNIMASESVTNLMNANKSQFIGTEENFSGWEDVWRDPSIPRGSIIANRDSSGNLPAQLNPPQISPSYGPLISQSISDIQSTLGFVNPNQQINESEVSGKAFNSRVQQGELSNFIYKDNLKRAIDEVYKVVLSLFPKLYDSNRSVMVRNKNGDQSLERLNEKGSSGMMNDMTAGKFTVQVTCGSNYETQLSENLDQLLQISSTIAPINPQGALAIMDLIAANTNLTNTPQIVDRLRAVMLGMPVADILRKEMNLPSPPQQQSGPDPMQMQMQIQQMQAQNESEKIKVEQQKVQVDSQKLQIEHEKNMVDRQKSQDEVEMKKIELQREMVAAQAEIEKKQV
jgi:hypothetical protein